MADSLNFKSDNSEKEELTLMLGFIKKSDPYQFSVISRKMVNHLYTKGINQAKELFLRLGSIGNEASIMTENNTPSKKQVLENSFSLGEEIFAFASEHVSVIEISMMIQKWLNEEKLNNLLKVLANQNTRIADISDAIHRYHYSGYGYDLTKSATGRGIIVSLIRRFLTDQLEFINIAKGFFEFNDFYELLGKTIYHPESHGKVGGKSAGVFLALKIIKQDVENKELFADIKMPKTWHITSDGTVNFMYYNNLEDVIEQKYKDIEDVRKEYHHIVQVFKNSQFSPDVINGLSRALDDFGENPIIVRSSSLLEDRLGAAFAGKYKSLFLCNQGSKQQRLDALTDAIAEVYSSTFSPDAIGYRIERGLLDFNEEMGIMIQEVVGTKVGKYFFPAFSGVAFSSNEFRWSPRIKREDGLVRMVTGLGTRSVDRCGNDFPTLFAPAKPDLRLNNAFDEALMYSQKYIDVLNLESNKFETATIEEVIKEVGGTFPLINDVFSIIKEKHLEKPVGLGINTRTDDIVPTFDNLISRTTTVKKINKILKVLEAELSTPVDIEFASDGKNFYLLQCRPQSSAQESKGAMIPNDIPQKDIFFTANKFISNGKIPDINYIVYVDPIKYSELPTLEAMKLVGRAVSKLNSLLPKQNFILMGPGRWGSRGDIKLGVNVSYSDINNTSILIEMAMSKGQYKPDLSFGTHFFQDLVESDIKYIPLYPEDKSAFFNFDFINNSENILERLVPEYSEISSAIKVINVSESSNGSILRILMNADEEQAIAFLTSPFTNSRYKNEFSDQLEVTAEEPWHIRLRIAEMIAVDLDMERFSLKAFYLTGSVARRTSTHKSDIDLLLLYEGTELQRIELKAWFEGWNLSLRERLYKRIGYKIDKLLDVKIFNDDELKNDEYFYDLIYNRNSELVVLKTAEA